MDAIRGIGEDGTRHNDENEFTDVFVDGSCIGDSTLKGLDEAFFCTKDGLNGHFISLNISNTGVDDNDLILSDIDFSKVEYLQCAGNKIASARNFCLHMPHTLLVLDLSYTESLVIERGSFMAGKTAHTVAPDL
jgi:hypothetical protein